MPMTSDRYRLLPVLPSLILAVFCGAVRADTAAQQLKADVIDAYKNTRTYEAVIEYVSEERSGRWTDIRRCHLRVAFDRGQRKLLLDTPDWIMVSDGKMLRMHPRPWGDVYLETPLPPQMTLAALEAIFPLVNVPLAQNSVPALPDAFML